MPGTAADPVIKRLTWRCRRGMRELDLLLLRFLEQEQETLHGTRLAEFEHLLEATDMDLYVWLTRRQRPDNPDVARLVDEILALGT